MRGLHLTADLHGCSAAAAAMTEPDALRALCVAAVEAAGLEAVSDVFHRYEPAPGSAPHAPAGITGVVLLAESHLAVHTWPELGAATLDVYVCNLGRDNSAKAETLLERLVAAFAPARVERHALERGRLAASGTTTAVPMARTLAR
jgi:S-adenosylmethionine decarboxylase proenzyme